MGKRTMRLIHFEMVASVVKEHRDKFRAIPNWIAVTVIEQMAFRFADEFEIRAATFDRTKFLKSCGIGD